MNEVDDAILEFFEEVGTPVGEPIELSPRVVHRHLVEKCGILDRTPPTFSRRMKKLDDRGLLERPDPDSAMYYLTEKGRQYLAGELDAEDLETDDEA